MEREGDGGVRHKFSLSSEIFIAKGSTKARPLPPTRNSRITMIRTRLRSLYPLRKAKKLFFPVWGEIILGSQPPNFHLMNVILGGSCVEWGDGR